MIERLSRDPQETSKMESFCKVNPYEEELSREDSLQYVAVRMLNIESTPLRISFI